MLELPEPPVASFASDNAAGVLPEVMDAVVRANRGPALAYGDDRWTERATASFRSLFGAPVEVFFVWGGTGANVVALQSALAPHQAVICPETAHIYVDECGAPERFTGSKLMPVATTDGKLRPDDVRATVHLLGDEHHVQPRVVSITQSTEMGTLYRPEEIRALSEVAHEHGMVVHLDGARIANATAALGGDLRSFTVDAGVDVISFGGTKAGMMYGEAVVFLDTSLGRHAKFLRKQATQLPSKLRFVAAQFEALLTDDLWLRAASDANRRARRLADGVRNLGGVTLGREPEVNSVFARLDDKAIVRLQEWSQFWVWDPTVADSESEVRWMTSFATTDDDVDRFVAGVRAVLAG